MTGSGVESRRHDRRRLGACGALIALGFLASPAGSQPVGVPAVVEHLLQGFTAPDCASRWRTIEEYPTLPLVDHRE
jgi:hypothetical protein